MLFNRFLHPFRAPDDMFTFPTGQIRNYDDSEGSNYFEEEDYLWRQWLPRMK